MISTKHNRHAKSWTELEINAGHNLKEWGLQIEQSQRERVDPEFVVIIFSICCWFMIRLATQITNSGSKHQLVCQNPSFRSGRSTDVQQHPKSNQNLILAIFPTYIIIITKRTIFYSFILLFMYTVYTYRYVYSMEKYYSELSCLMPLNHSGILLHRM